MSRKTYHVTPTGNGDWKVKREGSERADSVHQNKSVAIDRAKDLAKAAPLGQVIIHDKKGQFQTEYTYGDDPHPPKG